MRKVLRRRDDRNSKREKTHTEKEREETEDVPRLCARADLETSDTHTVREEISSDRNTD